MCLLRALRFVNVPHAQLEFPGGEYVKDVRGATESSRGLRLAVQNRIC